MWRARGLLVRPDRSPKVARFDHAAFHNAVSLSIVTGSTRPPNHNRPSHLVSGGVKTRQGQCDWLTVAGLRAAAVKVLGFCDTVSAYLKPANMTPIPATRDNANHSGWWPLPMPPSAKISVPAAMHILTVTRPFTTGVQS